MFYKHFGSPTETGQFNFPGACVFWFIGATTKWHQNAKGKWSWTNDMVKTLIDCIKDYRSACKFNTIDFNSHKVRLYEDVRKAMALVYKESDFGPNIVCVLSKPLKEMTKDEYTNTRTSLTKIKAGNSRIKEKLNTYYAWILIM